MRESALCFFFFFKTSFYFCAIQVSRTSKGNGNAATDTVQPSASCVSLSCRIAGLCLNRVSFPFLSYINLLSLFFHETVIHLTPPILTPRPLLTAPSQHTLHLSCITHDNIIPVSHRRFSPQVFFSIFSPQSFSVLFG